MLYLKAKDKLEASSTRKTQEFENVTPLVLKHVKAHECLRITCNPGYADIIYEQAHKEAQSTYEEYPFPQKLRWTYTTKPSDSTRKKQA